MQGSYYPYSFDSVAFAIIFRYAFYMSNRREKPKHSAHELVCKMRDERGITFSNITEQDAEYYLSDINNYLRIASYRKKL